MAAAAPIPIARRVAWWPGRLGLAFGYAEAFVASRRIAVFAMVMLARPDLTALR